LGQVKRKRNQRKIANIQFNSLDAIADQENNIELTGFVRSFAASVLSASSLELFQLVSD
jgi:hypothetical protein